MVDITQKTHMYYLASFESLLNTISSTTGKMLDELTKQTVFLEKMSKTLDAILAKTK